LTDPRCFKKEISERDFKQPAAQKVAEHLIANAKLFEREYPENDDETNSIEELRTLIQKQVRRM